MTQPALPVLGNNVGTIPAMIPGIVVRSAPPDLQDPRQGQVYVMWAAVVGHSTTYGVGVLDLLARQVTQRITFTDEPTDIAVTPDNGFIYLTGSSNLLAIQTGVWEPSAIPLSVPKGAVAGSPDLTFALGLLSGLAVTADGSQMLVAGQQMPNSVEENGYLALVDTGTTTVLKALTVSDGTDFHPHHVTLTPDGKYAIANMAFQRLDFIDLSSFTLAQSVRFNPDSVIATAVHPDSTTVFVARGPFGGASGVIDVVDIAEATVKDSISFTGFTGAPQQMALRPDGKRLFVTVGTPSQRTPPTLLEVDLTKGNSTGSLHSLPGEKAFAWGLSGQLANGGPFSVDSAGERLFVFDTASRALDIIELTG
jgi:DNA-binding beta-propeller fold protein YncE